ncbi:unnamed protein product [Rodentolepis nana]|uniref:RNAse_Pc domain-containing protein n=1 Tax=Rodentolepis nana TaxID=102285 RepID=A0A0R3T9N8_RODNA|nr:unnamed protein product [Rodentolepis nana]
MESEQLLIYSWLQATSVSKIIDDPGSGHKTSHCYQHPDQLCTAITSNHHPDKLCNDITNIMIRCAKKTIPRGKINFNQHPDKLCTAITNTMIRCAKKTIPRGKTKHLKELKRKRNAFRHIADQTGKT